MACRRLFVLVSTLALLATPALAAETRPVIELFTSQGCSSCPAADRVLGELARDGRVIALSVPVDYWDYLGWKDTLAQHAHSLRQRGYAGGRGDRQVYTPQVVVNGATQVIGSDRAAIDDACRKAATPSLPVSLARKADRVEIDVGAGQGAPASVWLLTVSRATPVAIGRGENQGRTITYSNVVRSWQRVAEWSGAALTSSVSLHELNAKDADAVVVLVQPGSVENPGPIRGASMLELR